jgi:hypothetical protein
MQVNRRVSQVITVFTAGRVAVMRWVEATEAREAEVQGTAWIQEISNCEFQNHKLSPWGGDVFDAQAQRGPRTICAHVKIGYGKLIQVCPLL